MRTKKMKKLGLADQAAELVEQVTPHVEAARERIVNDYLPAAQSMLADARDVAREVAQDARDAAQEAASNAEKSTRKSRKKAARKARSKASELALRAGAAAPVAAPLANKVADKVEPKPRRKKRYLLLLGLIGAGAVVVKRLRSGQTTPSYSPSYSPPRPASTPRPAPVATTPVATTPAQDGPPAAPDMHSEPDPVADAAPESLVDSGPGTATEGTADAGGAFLDEVAADADEQPHEVTTPDNPLEVENVAVVGKKRR
jgi:hypothetical protein